MINAVVFDFDGVILDTETADYETWRDLYRSYGAELELAVWARFIGWGTSRFDVFQHLEEQIGYGVDREALAIDDSAHGVTAAKAAGLHCLVVPNSVTAHMDLGHADLRVGSLAEVALREVLERVGGG